MTRMSTTNPNPPLGCYPNRCDKARSERSAEQHNQNDGKICFISASLLRSCPFTEGALQSAIANLRCSGSGGLARMARQEDARRERPTDPDSRCRRWRFIGTADAASALACRGCAGEARRVASRYGRGPQRPSGCERARGTRARSDSRWLRALGGACPDGPATRRD
jgi:hypothetical protein